MATIIGGSSDIITVTAGASLVVSSGGLAKISLLAGATGAGSSTYRVENGAKVFAPYGVDVTYRIDALISDCVWDEQDNIATGEMVVSTSDPIDEDGRPAGTIWLKVSA